MNFIKLVITIPLVIAVLVLAFVNNDLISLSLWPFYLNVEISLSVLIVFMAVFCFVFGLFYSWMSYSSLRKELRNYRKQNKVLNKQQEKLVKQVEGLHSNLENIKAEEALRNPPLTFKQKLAKIFGHKKVKENQ